MHIVRAVSFKVASTLMFAIMGAQVRYLGGAYPEGQVAFFRSVFALIPILIVFGWRGQLKGALRTDRPTDHLLRGVFSIVGTFATFAALARIPIADFTAIAFASPLLTVVFAAVFLKEKVHAYRWSAVAYGFCGVILMLMPYFGNHAALTASMTVGILFALTNAFTAGGASIQIRRLTSTETTSSIVIIMTLLGGAGTLWGPVIGVVVFEVLKEWMSSKTPYWYGILGLVFIVATIYLPRGIVGELQRIALRERAGSAARDRHARAHAKASSRAATEESGS